MGKILIREAVETDLNDVLSIERFAFGYSKEADLVRDLLNDSSAKPLYSLLAFINDKGSLALCLAKLNAQTC